MTEESPWIVVIRACAPMQSWGRTSRHGTRDTHPHPTLSGITGLIGNAHGLDKHTRSGQEVLTRIADTKMTIRIDNPGTIEPDYCIAQGVPNTEGKNHENAIVYKHHIQDGCFLVILEYKDRDTAKLVDTAIKKPKRPVHLGRKAYPVSNGWGIGLTQAPNTEHAIAVTPQCRLHKTHPDPKVITTTTPAYHTTQTMTTPQPRTITRQQPFWTFVPHHIQTTLTQQDSNST